MNKDLLVKNLQEKSLKAQRIICDYMTAGDQSIEGIEIIPGMSLSCKTACSRYKDELAKCKTDYADSSQGHKRKLLQEEYANVKYGYGITIYAFVYSGIFYHVLVFKDTLIFHMHTSEIMKTHLCLVLNIQCWSQCLRYGLI